MGNYFMQNLADGVALLASAQTWIEGQAIQQLTTTAQLPGMQRIVGMPDLHPGRGYPVGAAFFSVGRLYPALIGNDIGCGMSLWQTQLDRSKYSAEKLEKQLGQIDAPLSDDWQERIDSLALPTTGHESALGTIGGGNHFAEFQQIDTIYAEDALAQYAIRKKQLLLLVHSGSRGLGQQILRQHVGHFGHQGFAEATPECQAYLAQHAIARRFAQANRQLIAERILRQLRSNGSPILDMDHNWLQAAQIEGQSGWLHRKGAAPADQRLVVIPGSRGDFSYLLQPIPDALSLYSLAHGAGRKWMRSECRDRLQHRYTAQQLGKTALGSRVVCQNRQLMYEEAPEAYKPVSSIIETLQAAGLVTLLARMKPVLTYKTGRED